MTFDKDLISIQSVRDLIKRSEQAQKQLSEYNQEQIDAIVAKIAKACASNAELLAKLAVEETGFGRWQDKVLKNLLGSTMTYESCKDMKTIGIINEDAEKKLMDVGVPVGIVAALIPSTNPTSTTMYKAIISIKSGNSVIFSPHPNARKCILETIRIIKEAIVDAGGPKDTVLSIENVTLQAVNELITDRRIGMILATGGEAMVRAAYSSGNPAIGVGPGNGPAFIEQSADVSKAVRQIVESKTFDNGTICASEQSIITEDCIKDEVVEKLKKQGCYFMTTEEIEKLAKFILRSNGTMNPQIVGKDAKTIADLANIRIPVGTKILVAEQNEVGKNNPYAREKLCPILAFYTENSWERACERSMEILHNEGVGHTMTIHTKDESVVKEFALKKPVSRLLVNTPATLGGVGATTNLSPAFTLGCGAVGGSSTSDNITPMHLLNVRRVAYGVKELSDISGKEVVDEFENLKSSNTSETFSKEQVEEITKAVLRRLSIN
ncbi:acetaldehyde dehydrogenase [Dethiosulfatibacter aminovorans DSM 17477]|uniref:Acetaldehyde dehydrogenase n=1 Tax=Dethiosulfatibacter aminovorans DSM 17477 TaxID=1121476 RepID=A0A1M6DQF8_9FIRM|nr:acetaldehyde dehydrogenase (acetylating) [Dethiosulfatibacter aminovorans]SHI75476.1 acetaldehyde dehydrogenase [Dethiosulfatibacter aminovorans DSM 17477]